MPNAPTSIITIHNTQDLLERGIFVTTQEKKKRKETVQKGTQVVIKRPVEDAAAAPGGAQPVKLPTEFEVTDNCRRFKDRDW